MTPIEELARRLEPIAPDFVARWRLARQTADTATQTLLDQEISHQARLMLGNRQHGLLLSLPPRGVSRGRFTLGSVLYEQPKWPFGIRPSELLQGLAIYGRSGAGKTVAAFHLLLQLHRAGIPVVFLDWKRTVRHLLPLLKTRTTFITPGRTLAPLAFNPFAPPTGVDKSHYAAHLIDALSAAYTLGEGSRSVLLRELRASYAEENLPVTAAALLARVESVPLRGRAAQWKLSALRALHSVASISHGSDVNSGAAWASSIARGTTVVELDGLNLSARQFLVPVLFYGLYAARLGTPAREKLQFVVFIEEAHHVLYRASQRSQETMLGTLLRQCREVGIGVVIIDQHPHLVASSALGNTFATLCLNQKDPADISKAASMCLLRSDQKGWLSRLPLGQAVVKLQDRWREPFLIQIPPLPVDKGAVTDEVLRAYMRRSTAGSAAWERIRVKNAGFGRVPFIDDPLVGVSTAGSARSTASGEDSSPESESFRDSAAFSIPLNDDGLALLHDVATCPDDGVKARYWRLKWSMSRGTRIKNSLLYAGWLTAETLPVGATRMLILQLSADARDLVEHAFPLDDLHRRNVQSPRSGRESLAHEYWKRFYARQYEQAGHTVTLEAPRPPPASGRADILARRGNETVAIEIETGASNALENVRQNQRAGFARVVIVATSRQAERLIRRRLRGVKYRNASVSVMVAPAMP